jgi:hypothetical protein
VEIGTGTTTFAPILLSDLLSALHSKSTQFQQSAKISDLRQPVSSRSRTAVAATGLMGSQDTVRRG